MSSAWGVATNGLIKVFSLPSTLISKAVEGTAKVFNLARTEKEYRGKTLAGVGELQAGDVFVKYNDGTASNEAIDNMQNKLMPTYPYWFVHAGFITDFHPSGTTRPRATVEMDEDGLLSNDLHSTNKGYAYEVFRATNPEIAKEIGRLVYELAKVGRRDQAVNYNFLGAMFKSFVDFDNMVTLPEFEVGYRNMVENRNNEKYYCSQHVVWLVQGAKLRTRQPDDLWGSGSVHRTPASIAKTMKFDKSGAWTHVGHLPSNQR